MHQAEGRVVRLSWVNREAATLLLATAVLGVILTANLDADDPVATEGMVRVEGHDMLLEALVAVTGRDILISSGCDDTVRFWDVTPGGEEWGREVLALPHDSRPYALAPSPDGRYLAVGGGRTLTVWASGSDGWTPMATREGTEGRYLSFAPDSRSLAVGGEGGEIRVLDIPSMKEMTVLKGLTDMVHSVAFSPDGSRIAASSFCGELILWDAKTGERLSLSARVGSVHCFAFSSDGRTLATAPRSAAEGGIKLWDLATGRHRLVIRDGEGFNALAFSPDDRLLAAACVDQAIRTWDAESGELRGRLAGDVGWVKTLVFTRSGSRLAYGGRDGAIRFWDLPVAVGRSTAG